MKGRVGAEVVLAVFFSHTVEVRNVVVYSPSGQGSQLPGRGVTDWRAGSHRTTASLSTTISHNARWQALDQRGETANQRTVHVYTHRLPVRAFVHRGCTPKRARTAPRVRTHLAGCIGCARCFLGGVIHGHGALKWKPRLHWVAG